MGKEDYDVIVVGGGLSGSSAAMFCKKQGLKVLMLEKSKFPRDKTCGDAESGKTVGILRELGMDKEIEKLQHAKIHAVLLSSPNGSKARILFPKGEKANRQYGYVSKRILFDNLVFQKAKKMADKTIENFTVTDLIQENDYVVGVKGAGKDGKEQEFRAKIVVGADGATSIVAQKLGIANKDPDHYILAVRAYYKNVTEAKDAIELHFLDSFMPGYFWIFPVGDNEVNVGAGMVLKDMKKKKVNLREGMFKVIKEEKILIERFKNAKLVEGSVKGWQLPVGSTHQKNHGNGFLLVGDAGSLIDPFTGEGMGNGMTSGKYAALTAAKAIKKGDFSESFLSMYDIQLWADIGGELKTSTMMQRIGRFKFLLNWLIGKAERSEQAREMITSTLTNEEAKNVYLTPWFYIKLLFS